MVPPLPQYLTAGCCTDNAHCCNRNELGYKEKITNGVTGIRNLIKSELLKAGVNNFWVLDGLGALAGHLPSEGGGWPGNKELLPDLQQLLAQDGIHLTSTGNNRLAQAIAVTVKNRLISSTSKDISKIFITGGQQQRHYWRGFTSPVGSHLKARAAMHVEKTTSGPSGSGRGNHRFLPYHQN